MWTLVELVKDRASVSGWKLASETEYASETEARAGLAEALRTFVGGLGQYIQHSTRDTFSTNDVYFTVTNDPNVITNARSL